MSDDYIFLLVGDKVVLQVLVEDPMMDDIVGPMPPRDISFRGPQFTEIACWMLVNPTHKEFEQRRGTQKVKSSQACMPERGPFSLQTVFVREN